jgi:hypothetical protein
VQAVDDRDCLLTCCFIDTHVYYPRLEMIGAYGEPLLEWLTNTPSRFEFDCFSASDRIRRSRVRWIIGIKAM